MRKKALITGITGQDGAYLAKHLLENGYDVKAFSRKKGVINFDNLNYLNISNELEIFEIDLLDLYSVQSNIRKYRYNEIYNLSSQSSVSLSIERPYESILYNSQSVLNLLESIRIDSKSTKFLQAGSSEIFSPKNKMPINEKSIIDPQSPYGLSKTNAYYSVRLYRNLYNIFASNAILFNHESFLRKDNFFIKKIIKSAILIKNNKQKFLKVGNLKIEKDFGYAPDYTNAMHKIILLEKPNDFVVSSGKSLSLESIVYYVFDYIGVSRNKIVIDKALFRKNETLKSFGDNSKLKKYTQWQFETNFFEILEVLIEEENSNLIKKNEI